MRLIDANALTVDVLNSFVKSDRARDVIKHIQFAPTVDAVPVVRCKDCKWYAPNNDDSWIGCAFDTRHPEDVPKEDDFCSYGERKDDA